MDKQLQAYLQSLLPEKKDWITEMEHTASQDRIPVMDPVSMQFVLQLIRIQKPDSILEIGTAIGYSALRMADVSPHTKVTTIERDKQRFQLAKENVKTIGMQHRIEVVQGDALEILPELPKKAFQMIFIDAAKGHYKRFFELSHPLLKNNGIILSDNVLFRGYVTDPEQVTQSRHKKMVSKLQTYNQFISEQPSYSTSIVPIGDGVAISIKT